MICPACAATLTERAVEGIQVDVCDGGCGGIWFDQLELARMQALPEGAGAELLDLKRNPAVPIDLDSKRNCPCCANQIMIKERQRGDSIVSIDHCPECGGHWLDLSEFKVIRHSSPPQMSQESVEPERVSTALGVVDRGIYKWAQRRSPVLTILYFLNERRYW